MIVNAQNEIDTRVKVFAVSFLAQLYIAFLTVVNMWMSTDVYLVNLGFIQSNSLNNEKSKIKATLIHPYTLTHVVSVSFQCSFFLFLSSVFIYLYTPF